MNEPEAERLLWAGHPSHVKDLGFHLVCLAFAWLVFPLFAMAWRYLDTHCHRYEVTSERLRVVRGILSRRMEEVELYRVNDTTLDEPIFLRLFKLGSVELRTTDASTPLVVLQAVPDARVLRENLRGCIEKVRANKGVRGIEGL